MSERKVFIASCISPVYGCSMVSRAFDTRAKAFSHLDNSHQFHWDHLIPVAKITAGQEVVDALNSKNYSLITLALKNVFDIPDKPNNWNGWGKWLHAEKHHTLLITEMDIA